jgi:hypothetical protein
MNTTTTHTRDDHRKTATRTAPAALTLDDLAHKRPSELEALYRGGTIPSSLAAVDGALEGRMLAVRGLARGPIARALRRFAASPAFLWEGKTFRSETDAQGRGINRVSTGNVLGRQDLFPFTTTIAASALDGRDAIILDYDHPENPPYIRKIHDEIREVSPGVFLGPAMWKRATSPATVLWFALATGRRG